MSATAASIQKIALFQSPNSGSQPLRAMGGVMGE